MDQNTRKPNLYGLKYRRQAGKKMRDEETEIRKNLIINIASRTTFYAHRCLVQAKALLIYLLALKD